MGNTAAIYVRRSVADERDADESDRSGCGLPGTRHLPQKLPQPNGALVASDRPSQLSEHAV